MRRAQWAGVGGGGCASGGACGVHEGLLGWWRGVAGDDGRERQGWWRGAAGMVAALRTAERQRQFPARANQQIRIVLRCATPCATPSHPHSLPGPTSQHPARLVMAPSSWAGH